MHLAQQFQIARRKLLRLKDRWILPPPRNPHLVDDVADIIHDSPFLLISQIQRSGGTLLSQLFDGHPRLWVFPGELHLAKPKYKWPRPMLGLPPGIIFRQLVDHRCIEYARDGYKKSKLATERIHFDYDVGLHCAAFCKAFSRLKPKNQRQVLDIYFSTFFGSWLNFRMHREKPSFFCAFAADFAMHRKSVKAFFTDYPDGRMLSVIRDPATWRASAMAKPTSRSIFATKERAITHWRRSSLALRENKKTRPEQVHLVAFSDVIEKTELTLRTLCGTIGIPFDLVLTVPTFNRDPIESNSSFAASKGVINKSVLARNPSSDSSREDEALYSELLQFRVLPQAKLATE